jgi:hypothetical protein
MLVEFFAGIGALIILTYALDSVFHFGIFDKLDEILEKK